MKVGSTFSAADWTRGVIASRTGLYLGSDNISGCSDRVVSNSAEARTTPSSDEVFITEGTTSGDAASSFVLMTHEESGGQTGWSPARAW